MGGKKKFSLTSTTLSVICMVLVAEAATPIAVTGNSQFLWQIFLPIVSLLPYGLILSELGATYIGEGDIYDWTAKAYGHHWDTGVSRYYWINYPLWLASLTIMTLELLTTITSTKSSTPTMIIVELIFTWIVVWISFYPASDSTQILNRAAVIKVVLAVLISGLGLYVALTKGVANGLTLKLMLPTFDLKSLPFISVIISNPLGFEVIYTFADDMENPKKQIPQAIVAAGLAITAIHTFPAFGVGVAILTDQINTGSGMIDNFKLLADSIEGWFVILMAFLFLLMLFGNMISWSLGVSNTARYATENGDMPRFSEKYSKKNDMPIGAVLANDVIASVVIILAPVLSSQDLFWVFFSSNVVLFLSSCILVFPVFYKLKRIDLDIPRPSKVNGKPGLLKALVILPMIMIIISSTFIAMSLDFSPAVSNEKLPVTTGAIIFILFDEVIIYVKKIKEGMKENG